MNVKEYLLPVDEYYATETKKDTIYLHHTAGSHRPDFSIQGWDHDKTKAGGVLHVGTSYVIGGISTRNNETAYDGVIYKAFSDKYWAHHLGTDLPNNGALNQKSIGIEICNYGPLTKTKEGQFMTYVRSIVPKEMVHELETPFRGYKYYHKYTAKQIEATRELILDIAKRHNIDVRAGLVAAIKSSGSAHVGLDINIAAKKGAPGIWSHSNVLPGKFDIWPDPDMIKMLLNL